MKPPPRSPLFALVALIALPCAAQKKPEAFLTGKIKGVYDSTVAVIVDDPKGPAVWHGRAAQDGSYTVGPLPHGRYRVCVQAEHFAPVVKEMLIDSAVNPFSPRLNPIQLARKEECPSLSKALLALTPADLQHAWFRLVESGGTWADVGYSVTVFADGRIFESTRPIGSSGPDDRPTLRRRTDGEGVGELIKQFSSSGLFSASSAALPSAAHLPTTQLSFGADGLSKTVTHISGEGPKELLALEDRIKKLLNLNAEPQGKTLNCRAQPELGQPAPWIKPLLCAGCAPK